MSMTANDNREEMNDPSKPHLLIPYWRPHDHGPADLGDEGDRPLVPSDVIPYMCQGIMTAAPYKPGDPLTVKVSVRNCGGGVVGSIAMVRVWWEFPAPAYAMMSSSHLIGVDSVAIPPRGETTETGAMTHIFPPLPLPPSHICLIACIDHPQDQSPKRTDPAHSLIPMAGLERHWAQHNLTYIAPTPGGTINFPFMTSNPFQRESEFIFEVKPFTREKLDRLVRTVRAEPIKTEARFKIRAARDLRDVRSERQASHPYSIFLDAGSQTAMHLRIQLSNVPTEGQFAAFELLQHRRGDEHLVGGIAVIVLAPDKERR